MFSDDERYLRDSQGDRMAVFYSVLAVTLINLMAVPAFVYLCPDSRESIHGAKRELGTSRIGAKIYASTFCVCYLFIFVFNILIINPQTQCLKIVGGTGCTKF